MVKVVVVQPQVAAGSQGPQLTEVELEEELELVELPVHAPDTVLAET